MFCLNGLMPITDATHMICPDCEKSLLVLGSRTYTLISHMVNAGHISVGEARDELRSNILDSDSREFLAGWVLERSDQGDHWRAGDQETLPCGCIISYDRTQVGERCESDRCLLDQFLCDPFPD